MLKPFLIVFACASLLTVSASASSQTVPPSDTPTSDRPYPHKGGSGSRTLPSFPDENGRDDRGEYCGGHDTCRGDSGHRDGGRRDHRWARHPHARPRPARPIVAPTASTERVFAKLHTTDEKEIAAGNLALANTQTQAVRDYAQMMINDHTKADQQLMTMGTQMQLVVDEFQPQTAKEIRDEKMDQESMQKLQALRDADFDREYIAAQVKAHKMVLQWLRAKRSPIKDAAAQDFVKTQMMTIMNHYKMAKELRDTM